METELIDGINTLIELGRRIETLLAVGFTCVCCWIIIIGKKK